MDDPVVLRSLERILAVTIGGLAIYLGYRLFTHLQLQDSEGKFTFPGGTSIYLTRVGPGVFFALFGALVVGLALYKAVTFSAGTAGFEAVPTSNSVFHGATNASIALSQDPQIARDETRQLIGWLNRVAVDVAATAAPEARTDLDINLRKIKLVLMSAVWADDWGRHAEFQHWVLQNGALGSPPSGFEEAADYFRFGV